MHVHLHTVCSPASQDTALEPCYIYVSVHRGPHCTAVFTVRRTAHIDINKLKEQINIFNNTFEFKKKLYNYYVIFKQNIELILYVVT